MNFTLLSCEEQQTDPTRLVPLGEAMSVRSLPRGPDCAVAVEFQLELPLRAIGQFRDAEHYAEGSGRRETRVETAVARSGGRSQGRRGWRGLDIFALVRMMPTIVPAELRTVARIAPEGFSFASES